MSPEVRQGFGLEFRETPVVESKKPLMLRARGTILRPGEVTLEDVTNNAILFSAREENVKELKRGADEGFNRRQSSSALPI